MSGRLPAKKRRYEEADFGDDSSSSASFPSPISIQSSEDEMEIATYVPKESQESASPFSPDLGTQPQLTTPQVAKPKKRKVSMSPTDSLARKHLLEQKPAAPAKRTSPRSASKTLKAIAHPATPSAQNFAKQVEDPSIALATSKQDTAAAAVDILEATKTVTQAQQAPTSKVPDVQTSEVLPQPVKAIEITEATAVKAKQQIAKKAAQPKAAKQPKNDVQDAPSKKVEKAASASASAKKAKGAANKAAKTKECAAKTKEIAASALAAEKNNRPPVEKPLPAVDTTATAQVNEKTPATKQTPLKVSDSTKSSAKAVAPVKVDSSAVKKKKQKKRSFQDELLYYMFLACRPFTVKALTQYMSSSESAVEFCLLSLVDKQWVVKKEFASKGGRTKDLYWANQEAKAKELVDSLRFISPQEINEAKQELDSLRQQEEDLLQQMEQVQKEPSNKDLDAQLANAEKEVADGERQLEEALCRVRAARQSGGLKAKKPARNETNQKRTKMRINTMRGEWKKRKDKCTDFLEQLADGMEKKTKDVVKILELETDEMARVTMPPKHVIE